MFSICTMTYGDYPDLIGRTLDSLKAVILGDQQSDAHVTDVRIGLNEVSDSSLHRVMDWAGHVGRYCPVFVYHPTDNANVGKYPLMRRMFQEEPSVFKESKFVMWLDDDSYFDLGESSQDWWEHVNRCLEDHTLVGLIHHIRSRGNQHAGIKEQPWYNGHPVERAHKFRFATGAWWAAHSSFLEKWDYPFTEVYHNGGDSILGELCRQQEASICDMKSVAQCHAKCCYKGVDRDCVVHVNVGGRAGRRGLGKKASDEVYPWMLHGTGKDVYDKHSFDLKVYRFDEIH